MLKKSFVVLLLSLLAVTPVFSQKFTKKEQARREAREANFFYGASFTFTGGYLHSWLSDKEIDLGTDYFDKTQRWGQDRNSFNVGFLYDHLLKNNWGVQTGLFYGIKGGDHTEYRDQHLGSGPVLLDELTQKARNQFVELQTVGRYFIPVAKKARFSLNGGLYLDKVFKSSVDGFGKWDFGAQCGVGYDWNHTALSVTYQHSVLTNYIKDSKSMQSALFVNIGYRLWK